MRLSKYLIFIMLLFFITKLSVAETYETQIRTIVSKIDEYFLNRTITVSFVIMPLKERGEKTKEDYYGKKVSIELINQLKQIRDFRVIEQNELLDAIKQFKKNQTSGFKRKDLFQACDLLGAQAIIGGAVSDKGEDFQIDIKIINVKTSKLIFSESVIFQEMSKSSFAATKRSLLIPGLGQFYKQRKIKGSLLLLSEVGLISTAVLMYYKNDAAIHNMNNSSTLNDVNNYFDEAMTAHKIHQGCVYAAIGVWLYNIFDAMLFGAASERNYLDHSYFKGSQFRIMMDPTQKSIGIGYSIALH